MMAGLNGRKIVVMGGTSGIGLAAARQLVELGASVVVTGRNEERAAAVRQQNPGIGVQIVDANSSEALRAFYRAQGAIDDLVLCVTGGKGAGPFAEISIADLHDGFEQKFFAQFQAAQLALRVLRKDGSLTFVSAISARAANPGTAGLAAINGAIEAMIKPLARELRPLRVNAVSPGVVETPWWEKIPENVRKDLLQRSAAASLVGRNGSPEEAGGAIVFLVKNGFVTGTVIEVDGGLRLV
jgi:NAD(P)-dependent dehydrogenase (short-subunit alcohol dehydrogenase family)